MGNLSLSRACAACIVLACGVGVSGCDRAFVPVVPPDVRVIAPDDLDVARDADSLDLTVEATSFRPITSVRVGSVELIRVGGTTRWSGRVGLRDGLNVLPLTAQDTEGVTGVDTAFVYRIALIQAERVSLPSPRGGLTITLLPDGTLLAIGGGATGGEATSDAWTLAPGAAEWQSVPGGTTRRRTGHTATLLPDGRVLIAGGSSRDGLTDLTQLVESIEAYDPATGRFVPVTLDGAPILRTHHTAFFRLEQDVPVVELLGGRGNIDFLPNRRLGVREDVRTLAIRPDGVQALSPSGTTGQGQPVEPIEGHATVDVGAPGAPLFRTSGVAFAGGEALRQAFAFSIVQERLRPVATQLPRIGRFRSAYAVGLPGEMWTAGGESGPGVLAPAADLFVQRARRSFSIPLEAGVMGGAGYSDGNGGLCLVGGFDATGAAIDRHVCFVR